MRNGRIDQAEKFLLGFGAIIENLLRYINEAYHGLFLYLVHGLDLALFDLEEFEFGHIFLINVLHTWQILDYYSDILKLLLHLRDVLLGKFLFEGKDLRS